MRVDDRGDRPLAEVLADEVHRGPGRLRRRQRVDHDPTGLALHEADVGDVVARGLGRGPGTSSYRPCSRLSRAWRHRLGFTVAGAASSSRKAQSSVSRMAWPWTLVVHDEPVEPGDRGPAGRVSRSAGSSSGSSAANVSFAVAVCSVAALTCCRGLRPQPALGAGSPSPSGSLALARPACARSARSRRHSLQPDQGAGVLDLAHVAQAVLVDPALGGVEAGDTGLAGDAGAVRRRDLRRERPRPRSPR